MFNDDAKVLKRIERKGVVEGCKTHTTITKGVRSEMEFNVKYKVMKLEKTTKIKSWEMI